MALHVEYADLDDATRARFEAEAVPQPAAAVRTPQTLVELPAGRLPQLSRPDDLAAALVDALG